MEVGPPNAMHNGLLVRISQFGVVCFMLLPITYWSTNAAFCTTIKQMPNIKSAITPEITWIENKANKLEGWHFKWWRTSRLTYQEHVDLRNEVIKRHILINTVCMKQISLCYDSYTLSYLPTKMQLSARSDNGHRNTRFGHEVPNHSHPWIPLSNGPVYISYLYKISENSAVQCTMTKFWEFNHKNPEKRGKGS